MSSDSPGPPRLASDRLRDFLVRLYPRAWRERYGEEFQILLADCLHSPLDVLDIFLGAVDAHLQFPYDLDWRSINMTNKLRTSVFMVFAAYIGFIIGGLSLYGLVDDSQAVPLIRQHGPIHAAWTTVQAGAVIALLAVVVGALPLAIASARRALTSSRRDLWLLLVPAWSFLALILYSVFMGAVGKGAVHIRGVLPAVTPDNFPIGNRILLGGLMLVFLLGAFASTLSIWRVLNGSGSFEVASAVAGHSPAVRLYRLAFTPALIATLSMLLMLIATLAFGWLAYSAVPLWFQGNYGLLLINTALSFGITVAIMMLSSAAALLGVLRGYPSWRRA